MKIVFTSDNRRVVHEVAAALCAGAKPNESYTVARKGDKYVVVHRVIQLA